MSDERATRLDLAIALALAAVAVVAHAPLALRTVDWCDESLVLQAGHALTHGEVLYRDVRHIAGPGVFYFAAALFRLFGERFEVARFAMLGIFGCMTAAIYLLARRLTARAPAALASVWFIAFRLWTFPHWQMLHYASLAASLATVAFLVLRANLLVGSSRALLAGLFAGAAFLTKQDSGALGTLGCLAALILGRATRRRAREAHEGLAPFACFAIGAALPVVATASYFALEHALGAWLHQTILGPIVEYPLFVPAQGAENFDYVPFPNLHPLFSQDPVLRRRMLSYLPSLALDLYWRAIVTSRVFRDTNLIDLAIKFLFYAPYAILLGETVAAARAWRRSGHWRNASTPAVAGELAHFAFAAAMLAALSKPRDWIHLSVLVFPLAPIAARQLAALARALDERGQSARGAAGRLRFSGLRGGAGRRSRAAALLRGAVALAGLLYLGASAHLAWRAVGTYSAELDGAHGRAFIRPEDQASLRGVIAALRATPAERPVLAVPCLPLATFFAERPPLTGYLWIWQLDPPEPRDDEILARVDAVPELSLVYSLSHMPTLPWVQNIARTLYDGLAERFEMGPIFGADPERPIFTLARRRADPEESVLWRATDHLAEASASHVAQDGAPPEAIADVGAAVGVATWPLTPRVLSLLPGAEGETRLELPIEIPEGARLRLRAGVNPDLWQSLGPFPIRLRVLLELPGESHELLSTVRDVYRRADDRPWQPLDLDLGAFAGRRGRLVLTAAALGWAGGGREMAGFEDPRLVLPR